MVLLGRMLALVALVTLGAFVPLSTGLSAFAEAEGDCDCSSRHEDGDDEDHCPPFCGSCDDCAGCFHVHAVVTAPMAPPSATATVVPRPTAEHQLEAPPEAPAREPLHVPRARA